MEKEKENAVSLDDEPVINYRGITAIAFIVGNETFENVGIIGSLSNLLVYLTTVFNMKSVTTTTIVNIFNGTSNMTPLLGAFLSDSYFGRYKTLVFASISSLLGLIALTLTTTISKLNPPHCATKDSNTCVGSMPKQLVFLGVGFNLLIIGASGIRPFWQEEQAKFLQLYYFTFTFVVMISVTFIVYVQPNTLLKKDKIGFAIPTCLMFISCVLFFLGSRLYVKVKPNGSPLLSVAQVMVAATKKRRLNLPHNLEFNLFNYMPSTSMNSKLPYTDQFRFLDKAAIITAEDQINPNGSAVNPWKFCSLQQVEEVKCLARVIPVWASLIIFSVIVSQSSYAVFQALQSDRRLGNSNFKLTGKEGGITLLQRMGIGIVLSVLTMLASGLVEEKRRNLALTRPTLRVAPESGAISSMSGLWLIPQLVHTGLREAFCAIGQVEFFYKEFPENMRSIAGSIFFCGQTSSSYLSAFLISIVNWITERAPTRDWLSQDLNRGKLDYFFYMIAALGVFNFGVFLVCAKWYRYKGDGEIKLPTDQLALEINKAV
ncbi:hypothetical protein ACB094_01G280400 [Castanea mollissima]